MAAKKSSSSALKRRAAKKTDANKGVGKKSAAKKSVAKKSPRVKKPLAADAPTIHQIFAQLRAANPDPQGELHYVNAFTLLVAVVLSAQATDIGVNRATRPLFAIADTPQKMLALGEERVRDYVKTIGLFRTKAKNVIGL